MTPTEPNRSSSISFSSEAYNKSSLATFSFWFLLVFNKLLCRVTLPRVKGIGLGCKRCFNKDSKEDVKDAPGLSNLLRNIIRVSTPYL